MAIVKSKLLKQLSENYPNFLKKDLEKFTNIILTEIKRALKRGDRVITKSGLHGKIIEIVEGNDSCVLETMAGKIRYEVSAISFEMSSKLNTKSRKPILNMKCMKTQVLLS